MQRPPFDGWTQPLRQEKLPPFGACRSSHVAIRSAGRLHLQSTRPEPNKNRKSPVIAFMIPLFGGMFALRPMQVAAFHLPMIFTSRKTGGEHGPGSRGHSIRNVHTDIQKMEETRADHIAFPVTFTFPDCRRRFQERTCGGGPADARGPGRQSQFRFIADVIEF